MALTKIGILRNFLSTGIDDNANALALTLDTDENATFANGVTASSFSGDGSALTGLPGGGISYVTKTANYTASNDEGIIADTSGGSFTVTLPASPSAGDQVYIADPANWSTNNLTVARNGSTIEGASEDFTVDIGGIIVGFLYDGSTWQVYPQSGFASYQSLDSVLTIGSTTSQSLTVGELTVSGNLQVDGTTTTINSTTLTVDDKNIVLASGAADAAAADGSGISIDGASATLTYGSTNDAWSFNKDLGIGVANPAQRLDVREEKTGGGVLVQIYNEDNSDTTTQTAGIAMGPDTRGGTARITAVKENASFATNAGRDVALTFSSVLNNSPTERMRIDSAGNVGIGTTSPNAYTNYTTLTLNGATSSALDFEGGGTLMAEVFATANDLVLQTTNSDGQLIFKSAAGSEAMRIDAAGTVGVGVTPATDWGDDGIQIGAKGTLSGGSSYTGFAFNAYPTSSGWASKYTQTDEASLYLQGAGLHLWYNAASGTAGTSITWQERMRIAADGNVGIGTSSPSDKLHVYSGASGGSPHSYTQLLVEHSTHNAIQLLSPDSTEQALWFGDASSSTVGGVTYYHPDNIMTFRSNGSERMRINSAGNVGIGTTAPQYELSFGTGYFGLNYSTGKLALYQGNSTSHTTAVESIGSVEISSSITGSGSGAIKFNNHGAESMRIDSNGTLGIGVTPNSLYTGYWGIQVQNSLWFTNSSNFSGFTQNAYYDGAYKYTTTGTATAIRQISGRFDFLTAASGTADTAITWSTPMTITAAGDVGISTTPSAIISSSRILQVASGGNTTLSVKSTDGVNDRSAILELLSSGNGNSKSIILYGDTDTTPSTQSPLVWQSYHSGVRTERMRIDYTGGLRIGNAGNIFNSIEDEKLSVKNTVNGCAATFEGTDLTGGYPVIYVRDTYSDNGQHYALFFYRTNTAVGSITTTTTSTQFNTSSDYRLKENLVPVDNAIDRVKQLSTYRFNFISEANTTVDGFLAHEVADIVPEAVSGEKDAVKNVFDPESNTTIEVAEYQGIDQSKLVPLLTAALQEAIARIEALETP